MPRTTRPSPSARAASARLRAISRVTTTPAPMSHTLAISGIRA